MFGPEGRKRFSARHATLQSFVNKFGFSFEDLLAILRSKPHVWPLGVRAKTQVMRINVDGHMVFLHCCVSVSPSKFHLVVSVVLVVFVVLMVSLIILLEILELIVEMSGGLTNFNNIKGVFLPRVPKRLCLHFLFVQPSRRQLSCKRP